jgi:dTDP-4-amino-4,6-dideoxygalactose transaminase
MNGYLLVNIGPNDSMVNIPFFGVARQYQTLKEEILDAVNSVYETGQVLDGPKTEEFEEEIAKRCHRRYAVTVNSCSVALSMVQNVLGINENHVIIPTVSFVATLNSVLLSRNIPIFCDVDRNGLIDLEKLMVNPKLNKISALMYVNLFGNVVDYDQMRVVTELFGDQDMIIIEDAAQSFGSSYKKIPSGKLGDISVLSFDPTKNLPNYGSGGMILTDDRTLYQMIKEMKNNGLGGNYDFVGTNTKMNESDCAAMLVKLKYFDQWQQRRKEIADFYTKHLKNYVRVSEVSEDVEHAWHKFPIWFSEYSSDENYLIYNNRRQCQLKLAGRGIPTKIHYDRPLHEMNSNPNLNFLTSIDQFSVSETHCKTELSLPIYPELTDLEVEYITKNVIDCICFENID